VDPAEIEGLAAAAERDYYGDHPENGDAWAPGLPGLTALGRRLFEWLDGAEGWLRAGFAAGETTVLLDLAGPLQAQDPGGATELLAHLPWELMHDGRCFLAEQGVQAVRVMHTRRSESQPANRPLRLLFMAASPENVVPVLDFEREEGAILRATNLQPVDLVVEESGCVAQLENLVDSFDRDYFDVFHITGHATIEDGAPLFLTEDEQGRAILTSAGELADAFGHRWPRLLFLSEARHDSLHGPRPGERPSRCRARLGAPGLRQHRHLRRHPAL
jgi:hypothetical protein